MDNTIGCLLVFVGRIPETRQMPTDTVLVIIKLTKVLVPVRFRCGCNKLTCCLYFIIFCDISERCT